MNGIEEPLHNRRARDRGLLCLVALRFSQLWDFVDNRNIDKHIVAFLVVIQTYRITGWAFEFARQVESQPGLEIAAIITAILAPWTALVLAVAKWYFERLTALGKVVES